MADEKEDTRECEAMRKIFVGGLPKEVSDEQFLEYFSQFGNTIDNIVMKCPQTGSSRGFGFITYDASSAVENVFQKRPHILEGKTVDCKRAMPKEVNNASAHAKVTKLFVGGLKEGVTEDTLREYFESRHQESCGKIVNIELVAGKPFGFIETSDNDFADRLVISEGNFSIDGKQMHLQKSDSTGGRGGGRGGRGGGRGGRGGRGGFGGRGAGGRGGSRGGFGGRGGGYSNGGYGGYNQSQNDSYGQSYGQNYNQYGQGGYGQQSYGQNYQQNYGNYDQTSQGYGNYNQSYGQGGNQGGQRW